MTRPAAHDGQPPATRENFVPRRGEHERFSNTEVRDVVVAVLIMGPVLAELLWGAWLMGVEIGRKQEVTAVVVALALWPLACVLAAKVKEVLERRKLAAMLAEPDAIGLPHPGHASKASRLSVPR